MCVVHTFAKTMIQREAKSFGGSKKENPKNKFPKNIHSENLNDSTVCYTVCVPHTHRRLYPLRVRTHTHDFFCLFRSFDL